MIYEKLSAVQQALKAPKDQFNDFGKYHFRSAESILEAVKPLLKANGLVLLLSDEMEETGGRVYVHATAELIDLNNEHISVHAYAREEESKKGMDASQVTGAASSYARKYALNGLFCIDDNKDSDFTNRNEETEPDLTRIKKEDFPYCAVCGARLPDKVHKFSLSKYGRPLCMECQKKEK